MAAQLRNGNVGGRAASGGRATRGAFGGQGHAVSRRTPEGSLRNPRSGVRSPNPDFVSIAVLAMLKYDPAREARPQETRDRDHPGSTAGWRQWLRRSASDQEQLSALTRIELSDASHPSASWARRGRARFQPPTMDEHRGQARESLGLVQRGPGPPDRTVRRSSCRDRRPAARSSPEQPPTHRDEWLHPALAERPPTERATLARRGRDPVPNRQRV